MGLSSLFMGGNADAFPRSRGPCSGGWAWRPRKRRGFQRGGFEVLSYYLPILIFLGVATALAVVMLVLGTGLGRYFARFHDDKAKNSPYECGFEAFEDSRKKFDVRYFLVAILFKEFDLEIAFLFP